jgi:hypothetical protein
MTFALVTGAGTIDVTETHRARRRRFRILKAEDVSTTVKPRHRRLGHELWG